MEYVLGILIFVAAVAGYLWLDRARAKAGGRNIATCTGCGLRHGGECGAFHLLEEQERQAKVERAKKRGSARESLWGVGDDETKTEDDGCPDGHTSLPEYREEPPKYD